MVTRVSLTEVLGAAVEGADGSELGRVVDLVVDLAGPSHPVTRLLVETPDDEQQQVRQEVVRADRPDRFVVVSGAGPTPAEPLLPTEVRLERDVLDAPVLLARPARRTRVSDVLLKVGTDQLAVIGLDVSAGTAWRRLLRRRPRRDRVEVPMSQVHLVSRAGHTAHLATPGSLVYRLGPADMAEVLTRLSVTRAREVVAAVDEQVTSRAVELLHPHVRSRVTGSPEPRRRMLRLHGWRLHRPQGRGGEAPVSRHD